MRLVPKAFRRKPRIVDSEPGDEEIGFIAQDVLDVLPHAVRDLKLEDDDPEAGSLSVSLDPILAAAVNAIKAQQSQIEAMQAEIAALKATIH